MVVRHSPRHPRQLQDRNLSQSLNQAQLPNRFRTSRKLRCVLPVPCPPKSGIASEPGFMPKLRSGEDLSVGVDFSVSVSSQIARSMETELRQILDDLGLSERVRVERS